MVTALLDNELFFNTELAILPITQYRRVSPGNTGGTVSGCYLRAVMMTPNEVVAIIEANTINSIWFSFSRARRWWHSTFRSIYRICLTNR